MNIALDPSVKVDPNTNPTLYDQQNVIQQKLYKEFDYANSNPLVQNPFETPKPIILPSQIPDRKMKEQLDNAIQTQLRDNNLSK